MSSYIKKVSLEKYSSGDVQLDADGKYDTLINSFAARGLMS